MYEKIQVEEQASFTQCGQDGYVLGVHDLLLVSLQLLYTVCTDLPSDSLLASEAEWCTVH